MRTIEAGPGPIETTKPKRFRLGGNGADECATQRYVEGIHATLMDTFLLTVTLLQRS